MKHTYYIERVLEKNKTAIWAVHLVQFQHVFRCQVRQHAHLSISVAGIAQKQERVIIRQHLFRWLQILPPLHHSLGSYPRYSRHLAHPLGIYDGAFAVVSLLQNTEHS